MISLSLRLLARTAPPLLPVLLGLLSLTGAALAQTPAITPPATPPPATTPPPTTPLATTPPPAASPAADPVVATVNGEPIHLSDVAAAEQALPPNARNLPQQTLYPIILGQLIDGKALVIEARAAGLDKDPAVQRQVEAATEHVLQTAMLSKIVGPSLTDEALRARYQKDVAAKAGEEEVHARHILVDNEALAKKIIAELKQGADFVALAKQYSKDPGADKNGDLGFFRKDEMVPAFATAAFALKPGQISDTPVHTQFGWHVIQVLERRQAPTETFEQARDGLRQKAIQQGVQQAVADARSKVTVEQFNPDGSPRRATDKAEPPPAKP
jgi:peptidyl-prolyl cis-trans isomerase C